MASDNVRPENATQTSRILNQSGDDKRDNHLDDFPSDSGALREHRAASNGGQSSTNPTTNRLTDTPISHARNAQQVVQGVRERALRAGDISLLAWDAAVHPRSGVVLQYEGERCFILTETELKAIESRLTAIVAQLAEERARRLEVLRLQLRQRAAIREQLAEMDRTNEELSDKEQGFTAAASMIDALESQR